MAGPKAGATLPLFGERPSSGEAWALVDRVPIGARLCKQNVTRGRYRTKYWFAYVAQGHGKPKRIYVGTDANKRELELAWQVVSAELEAAEASPEVRKLRELEKRAGKLARTSPSTAEVPILAMRPK